jgi:hypothetical protein
MRVYIGPYAKHWNAHRFQRWYLTKKYKCHYWDVDELKYDRFDRVIDSVSEKLQDVFNATINRFEQWRACKIKIRIDRYDTWGMDHTLALIILPMLKQLRDTKSGSPFIDYADVPEQLRPTEEAGPDNGYTDNTIHKRWNWVLDEMIWTFEQLVDEESDSQFYSGEHDILWEKKEGGHSEMKCGPNDTFKVDREGMDAWNKRIDNGLRLFGKYFRNLWD